MDNSDFIILGPLGIEFKDWKGFWELRGCFWVTDLLTGLAIVEGEMGDMDEERGDRGSQIILASSEGSRDG